MILCWWFLAEHERATLLQWSIAEGDVVADDFPTEQLVRYSPFQ
jgi:hypothetical protein